MKTSDSAGSVMRQGYILVAEDDDLTREIIIEALESLGHTCQSAANGLEALNLLQEDKFDLVVSNIGMPGMTGLELIAQVRQTMPDMPFILTSGYHTGEKALEAGAQDFFKKPFNLGEFGARVNQVLQGCSLTGLLRHRPGKADGYDNG